LLAADKPVNRRKKATPCFGIGKFCRRFGSLGDTNGLQKIALCDWPDKASAAACRTPAQGTEINPMRQIGVAWLVKYVNGLVIGNGLKAVATWPVTAIIND
jgi:hypothetical protein